MKIAILRTYLSNKMGGAEISANLLTDTLIKNKQDVFTIAAKCDFKPNYKFFEIPLINRIPNLFLTFGTGLLDVYMAFEIKKILKKERPDMVHIQDFSILVAAASAARELNIPVVFTVRDYRFVCNLSECLADGKIIRHDRKSYLKCMMKTFSRRYGFSYLAFLFFPFLYSRNKEFKKVLSKVDHFITVSNFVKKHLILSGIDKNKISTVYNLAPEWKVSDLENKDRPIVFSSGLFVRGKGFSVLIDSMRYVAEKNKNVRLIIAGSGPDGQKLRKQITDLKLEGFIRLIGRISFSQMKDEYAKSSVIVMPSVWPEPLSRTIYESFAASKPIIATDTGGTSEIVKNNVNGFVVSANDPKAMANAIIKAVSNKKLRENMGRKGHTLIKEINKAFYMNHMRVYWGLY